MRNGVIGILGGMGPDATAAFFSTLVRLDVAATDQDHLHIIVDSDPSIPDRTRYLLEGGSDPLPAMLASAQRLLAAGAAVAGIPCMTAHAFLPRLRRNSTLPFLSAFEETCKVLETFSPPIRNLGILATMGTRRARLFEDAMPDKTILWPREEDHHSLVMEAIYGPRGIKAGKLDKEPHRLLTRAADGLIAQGAEAIVAGCTEVPLVLSQKDFEVPFIDPMYFLARALIEAARKGVSA
jgi:aspartate racemase